MHAANGSLMNKIVIEDLSVQYSDGTESLKNINLSIRENCLTVLFGPAGGLAAAIFAHISAHLGK